MFSAWPSHQDAAEDEEAGKKRKKEKAILEYSRVQDKLVCTFGSTVLYSFTAGRGCLLSNTAAFPTSMSQYPRARALLVFATLGVRFLLLQYHSQ